MLSSVYERMTCIHTLNGRAGIRGELIFLMITIIKCNGLFEIFGCHFSSCKHDNIVCLAGLLYDAVPSLRGTISVVLPCGITTQRNNIYQNVFGYENMCLSLRDPLSNETNTYTYVVNGKRCLYIRILNDLNINT